MLAYLCGQIGEGTAEITQGHDQSNSRVLSQDRLETISSVTLNVQMQ